MSREKYTLGDLSISIQPGPFGSQLHSSDYAETGVPIVMPKDMKDGKILHSGLLKVPEEHAKRLSRHQVHAGNLMIARKGDVRKCILVTDYEDGWMTGSDCLKVVLDTEKCYPPFIYYQLRSPYIGRWMEMISIGATMPSLNTRLLSSIEISLPNYVTQVHRSNFLVAYDKLIENNQKQIKLLEEAAQRLYKEWFVDLRFPGYEDVEIVDGIPEGWAEGTLGDIAFFKRGKTITKASVHEGSVPVVAGGLEPAYYHNKSNTVAPVITVSGSGANAGFTRLYNVDVFASDCSFADSQSTEYLYFAYCFLKANMSQMQALQKGSAQPHVYAKDINALELLIPHENILNQFCGIVAPLWGKIGLLQRQIPQAKQARDRLLPKLMSGKLEV